MNYIKTFNPQILLGDRLGLSLYSIFVEEYLLGGHSSIGKKMYKKFISHFPKETRFHTPANFTGLIDNVVHNGFSLCKPVYANPQEYMLLNGSHRCAIAIQLGIKEVPYSLRFSDSRIEDFFFYNVFNDNQLSFLLGKRDEYIAKCDPLTALKCRIRIHMRENPQSFNSPFSSYNKILSLRLYQGFETLGILGKRPSEKRISIYQLPSHLNKSMRVLDVGCNVGFFSLAVSKYVKSLDAFDSDRNYIKVAKQVQDFCNIKNCSFFVQSVTEFSTDNEYDMAISSAVHGWSGLPFGKYISLLSKWVKNNGLILFESHEIDAHRDWPTKKALLLANFELVDSGLIDDVDNQMYESEIREFLILRKKENVDYSNIKLENTSIDLVSVKTKYCKLLSRFKNLVWARLKALFYLYFLFFYLTN